MANERQFLVRYLGDAVYVWFDKMRDQIILATGSHDHPDKVIVLEPETASALIEWCNELERKLGGS